MLSLSYIMKDYKPKEKKILKSISENCKNCFFSNRCLEEQCSLYRIERIITDDGKELSGNKQDKR